MAYRVPARLTAAEGRRFGLTVGAAFLALAALLLWRGHDTIAGVFATAGVLLVAAGIVIPDRLGPVYQAWMGLARAMSKVTTPLFMGAVYYLVITPIGILRRTLGEDPLRPSNPGETAWASREAKTQSDLTRQF